MINKIINEIHNDKYTMKHIEAVMAIDFETIVIVNGGENIGWDIENAIKDNRYHIYESHRYSTINDEVYDNRDLERKQYELHKEFGDKIYQKWHEFINQRQAVIIEIKIEKDDFYLKQLYEEYQEREARQGYMTVKDLIKRLQNTDQDARVVIEDQEWGGYHSLYHEDDCDNKPMKITTIRDCPDCSRGCCHKCPGREIFNEKLLSF